MNEDEMYWEEYTDFISENRVDKRWVLKSSVDDKSYGSLRIVSHPDLRPGYLRSIYTYLKSIRTRSRAELLRVIAEYQMNALELDAYNVKDDVEFETTQFEAPYKELEKLFNVKVF